MKKFLYSFLVCLMLVPCVFMLAACGDIDNKNEDETELNLFQNGTYECYQGGSEHQIIIDGNKITFIKGETQVQTTYFTDDEINFKVNNEIAVQEYYAAFEIDDSISNVVIVIGYHEYEDKYEIKVYLTFHLEGKEIGEDTVPFDYYYRLCKD